METIGTRADLLGQGGETLQRKYEGRELAMAGLLAVPACVEAKLAHLASLKAEAWAALRVVEEQVGEEHTARRDTAAELERAKAGVARHAAQGYVRPTLPPNTFYPNYGDGHRVEIRSNGQVDYGPEHVQALEARVARLTANEARLRARLDDLRTKAGTYSNLLARCEEWGQAHREGLREAVARATRHVGELPKAPAPDKLGAALVAARGALEELGKERQTVEQAGVTVEEAKARAIRYVDDEVAKWEPSAGIFFARDQNVQSYLFAGTVPPVSHTGFPGFAVRYCADQLKAELLASIDAEAALGHRGLLLTDAERAARLADLDRRLYQANVLEESLVLRLEAEQRQVARRANAMPEAVLAVVLDEERRAA